MDSILSWSSAAGLPCFGGGVLRRAAFPLLRRNILSRAHGQSSFDSAAFEAERNQLDAAARQSMAVASQQEVVDGDPKAWKWQIRKRIWDLMEAEGIAQNPRPVHHRIPNFVGASSAADLVFFFAFSRFKFYLTIVDFSPVM